MYWLQTQIKTNIDSILMGIGLVFMFLIVPLFVKEHGAYGYTISALLDCVENEPLVGLPAFCFGVAGCSLVTVAIRGIFQQYKTPEERFESFFRIYFVELVILVGVGLVSLGVRDSMMAVPPGLFRLIGLVVGVVSAVLLGNQLSFPPPLMQWACVLGGLFGFGLGPVFYYLLFFLVIVLFVQPLADQMPGLGRFLPLLNANRSVSNSNPLIGSNQSRIDTMRQRIRFIKQQTTIPANLAREEIARLEKEITSLGGNP